MILKYIFHRMLIPLEWHLNLLDNKGHNPTRLPDEGAVPLKKPKKLDPQERIPLRYSQQELKVATTDACFHGGQDLKHN